MSDRAGLRAAGPPTSRERSGALIVETSVTRNRPRLLIIAPAWSQGWWGGGKVLAPPLVLPLLAALTPADVDVRLVDENVEPVV